MPLPFPRRSAASRLPLAVAVAAALSAVAPAAPAGAAIALAEIGPFSSYAVGHVPGGGYLVVWHDAPSEQLRVQRVSPAGFPLGGPKVLLHLFAGDSPSVSSVAVRPDRSWAVFWTQANGADQIGIGGAFFTADDHPLGLVVYPDPIPDPHQVVTTFSPIAAAFPGGGYAVAFTLGDVDPPSGDPLRPTHTRAFVMRVDRAGNAYGHGVQASDGIETFQGALGVGAGGGQIVVLTSAAPEDHSTSALRVRLFDLGLAPRSAELPVAEAVAPGQVHSPALAVAPDGRFLVAWREDGPDGDHGPGNRMLLRPFGADGHPSGPSIEPAGQAAPVAGTPALALTEQGVAWVSWLEPEVPGDPPLHRIGARPFDLEATPLGAPLLVDTLLGGPQRLTGGVAGALLTWRPENDHPTLLGAIVGMATGGGTPPPELALTSTELPGFRVWARFTSASGATRFGTAVAPCLAETLCVAGALPDRTEMLVRVVGPRPNGFLWPILAPLTVSRVEVWIEQFATGAVRHYLLPGSEPPSELLPGQFDRDGFRP